MYPVHISDDCPPPLQTITALAPIGSRTPFKLQVGELISRASSIAHNALHTAQDLASTTKIFCSCLACRRGWLVLNWRPCIRSFLQ
jgi:hypothetical protein